jgi:hypothetical protein
MALDEIVDVVEALSTPLKTAWVLWLAWGVVQVVWYRVGRAHPAKTHVLARRAARKPAPIAKAVGAARPVTPQHVEKSASVQAEAAVVATAPVVSVAPALDPSTALAPSFSANADVATQRIVADSGGTHTRHRQESGRGSEVVAT